MADLFATDPVPDTGPRPLADRLRPQHTVVNRGVRSDIAFIGEIDLALDLRQCIEQTGAPVFVECAQATIHLAECLTPLARRLRVDEIDQPFGFGQVHSPIFNGASCKLSGFRLT